MRAVSRHDNETIVWEGDDGRSINFINTFSHQSGARSIIFQSRQRFGVIQRRLAYVGLQSRPSKQPQASLFRCDKTAKQEKVTGSPYSPIVLQNCERNPGQAGCFAMVWTRLMTNAYAEDPQYWTGIPFGHVLPK